jgi:hypothetical protein
MRLEKELTEEKGWRLRHVQSGGEALDSATQVPPTVLVAKENLPDLTGSMVVNTIKASVPSLVAMVFAPPTPGHAGEVRISDQSRLHVLLPHFVAPSELIAQLTEVREALTRKSRERRYVKIFRPSTWKCCRSATGSSKRSTSSFAREAPPSRLLLHQQVAQVHVAEGGQHGLAEVGVLGFHLSGEQRFHLLALGIGQRSAQIARQDGHLAVGREVRQILLRAVDERPDHVVGTVVAGQARRHGREFSPEEQVEQEGFHGVVAVVAERDLGAAEFVGEAVQDRAAEASAHRAGVRPSGTVSFTME